MTGLLVVSDTSSIRVLHHLLHLRLLSEFFDEILIPPAVARELEAPESRVMPVPIVEVPKCRVVVPKDMAAIEALEKELHLGEKRLIPKALPLILRARDEMNFFISDAAIEQVRKLAGE